jgi:hypothetical protein
VEKATPPSLASDAIVVKKSICSVGCRFNSGSSINTNDGLLTATFANTTMNWAIPPPTSASLNGLPFMIKEL